MTSGALTGAVAALAKSHGVQTSFHGADGRQHLAEEAVVVAVLRALGVPLDVAVDADGVLRAHREELASRILEPVLVHRIGKSTTVTVTLPDGVHPREVWCSVEHEDGRQWRRRLIDHLVGMQGRSEWGVSTGHNRYRLRLDPEPGLPIAPGYHRFIVEWPGTRASALFIAAPLCPQADRGWGVFLPLHALRTDHDWGVGSYGDMAELGQWVGGLGGSMLGALPLYPAFLDPPADPSPYLPVSRLAYNEIFIDPTSLPELETTPEARRMLAADEFRRRIESVRGSALVDYEEVARLRRQVLTPMAEALMDGTSARHDAFRDFMGQHPELVAYARFRATADRVGHRTPEEIESRRDPQSQEPTLAYHLYVQWVAAEQLSRAARSTPLYADLPVGVHPDGFDPLWAPDSFALDAHGGAPPDLFFSGGQDWAFPPLHPERIREHEYRYFIETLRRAVRHAAFLRVDHVMGLQRMYWIPKGFDAQHGAYVWYRAQELHAIVALEAHRAGTVVVGEDLGTVPDEVRRRMADDRMLRSFVLQFESSARNPLPTPPVSVLASWGTHDLPRFTSYFWGNDIDEQEVMGRLPPAGAAVERAGRTAWRRAVLDALHLTEEVDDLASVVLRAFLSHLACGDADLVLVDLQELWGETMPQNHPGTGVEAGNWRRRAIHTLEWASRDPETNDFFRELHRQRRGGHGAPIRIEVTQ